MGVHVHVIIENMINWTVLKGGPLVLFHTHQLSLFGQPQESISPSVVKGIVLETIFQANNSFLVLFLFDVFNEILLYCHF